MATPSLVWLLMAALHDGVSPVLYSTCVDRAKLANSCRAVTSCGAKLVRGCDKWRGKSCAECDIPDDSVGTLAKLLCDGIAFVNNKVLVEDLENLASREVRHFGRTVEVDLLETETMRREERGGFRSCRTRCDTVRRQRALWLEAAV